MIPVIIIPPIYALSSIESLFLKYIKGAVVTTAPRLVFEKSGSYAVEMI